MNRATYDTATTILSRLDGAYCAHQRWIKRADSFHQRDMLAKITKDIAELERAFYELQDDTDDDTEAGTDPEAHYDGD